MGKDIVEKKRCGSECSLTEGAIQGVVKCFRHKERMTERSTKKIYVSDVKEASGRGRMIRKW